MLKAVLFDAGGTLLRVVPSFEVVYAEEAAALGAPIRPEVLGPKLYAVFRAFYPEAFDRGLRPTSDEADRTMWVEFLDRVHDETPELRPVDPGRWFDRLTARFARGDAWQPFPDACEVLGACRAAGLRLAIVSNWSTALPAILEHTGLYGFFDAVLVSAECGAAKPGIAIFRKALKALGVAPSEALHIGDTYVDDVLGALGAGIRPVFLDRSGVAPHDGVSTVRCLRDVIDLLGHDPEH